MSISDILSFWSTLQLKCWRRYINFKFDLFCDLVTSSMTSCINIYIIVVIISWYICTGSLMMLSLLVFQLSWKMLLFHIQRNIEGRLWGHPVTSSMTSSSWKYFFGIIWDDHFISEIKFKLCLIFQNFQNGRYFELATNFFYRKLYRKLDIPEG